MSIEQILRISLPLALSLVMAGCTTTAPSPAVPPATTPQPAGPAIVPVPVESPAPEVVTPATSKAEPEAAPGASTRITPFEAHSSPPVTPAGPQPPEAAEPAPTPTESLPSVVTLEPKPAAAVTSDAPSVAFLRAGETLVFKMNWGVLSNIGETRIQTVEETVGESRRFRITIATKSRGLLDAIYPVVNDSESVIERSTGRPLEITVEGKSGKRPTRTHTVFDYDAGRIVHTDHIRPARSGTAELPPEPAYDLMVAMLKSRDWGMQPGDKRDLLTAFEDEFYFITLTAHRREKVTTGAGTFEAVMIEPTQNGEQKGFFRRGGSMRYWISDGPNPQVVKMVFKTKAGTLTALLDKP